MNRVSGQALSGWPHVHQSIIDILTTPIGTRVMRRDYGADTLSLIDEPMTEAQIRASIVAAEALERWEPRFRLTRVVIVGAAADGHLTLEVEGLYIPDGQFRTVQVTI